MNKRYIIYFIIIGLFILLSACSTNDKEQEVKEYQIAKLEEKIEVEETPTSEESYDKYIQSISTLNSFHNKSTIQQKFLKGDNVISESAIHNNISFIANPNSFYSKTKSETASYEMYLVDNMVYIQDEDIDENWLSISADNLQSVSNQGVDLLSDFDKMASFKNDFDVEVEEQQYILSIQKSGDNKNDINQFLQDNVEDIKLLNGFTISEFSYTLILDKKTFLPHSTKMIINGTIKDSETEEISEVEITYSNEFSQLNEVKEIKVPQEILDKVVPLVE